MPKTRAPKGSRFLNNPAGKAPPPTGDERWRGEPQVAANTGYFSSRSGRLTIPTGGITTATEFDFAATQPNFHFSRCDVADYAAVAVVAAVTAGPAAVAVACAAVGIATVAGAVPTPVVWLASTRSVVAALVVVGVSRASARYSAIAVFPTWSLRTVDRKVQNLIFTDFVSYFL